MKRAYYFVLVGLYVAILLLLHTIGAVVGLIGVFFTVLSHLVMLQPKNIGRVWRVYVLSVKYF